MNKKIIHLGLPKTGTTFLQNIIYPKLCKKMNYHYIGKSGEKNKYYFQMMYLKYAISNNFEVKKKFGLKENFFISHEGLLPGDPEYWENSAKKLKFFFGNDPHIIIIIRQPSSFLSSIYQEHCLTQGYFIDPERFFLDNDDYHLTANQPKFNIAKFDYDRLIKIFQKNFKNVTIFKFENIFKDKVFLNKIGLGKKITNEIDFNSLAKKPVNTSLSIKGVKIIRFISKILNRFGLNMQPNKNNYLISDFEKYMQGTNYKTKKKKIDFNILSLFRNYIDPLLGSEKVKVNFKNIKIDISRHDKKYFKYSSIITKQGNN